MSLVQFALFFPVLLFAFSQGAKTISKLHCRSQAVNAAVGKTLEGTVKRSRLAMPVKFNMGCGFILKASEGGQTAYFTRSLRGLPVKFELSTSASYE